MVRRSAARVILAALLCGAAAASARAQTLQRLTVESFALSTDQGTPKAGAVFHLTVALNVRERVSSIENLDLPMLAQLDLLGDERQTVSGPRGTQYRETIAVSAPNGGPIAVAPATLQAIDARDGKAKQWYTNGLTLHVVATASSVLQTGAQPFFAALWFALRALLWLIAAISVVLLAVVLFRRRRAPAPLLVAAAHPMPVTPPERSRRQHAEDALTVLAAERTRAAAVVVRGAIWRMVGAAEGETLGDVLGRPQSKDLTMRGLLIALERSAFTYDDDLSGAIEDACAALRRYIDAAA
ncbi:MAG TPA: hypothetical protein VFF63_05280 [Candidatus Babeliales bacterium]|nr:hypothetical protein [Candidatus Babeliales bacterium]